MPRLKKTDFSGGLFLSGALEAESAGSSLNQARDIGPIKVQGVRSRLGSRRFGPAIPSTLMPVSVYKYNGSRYAYGVDAGIAKLFNENGDLIKTNMSGNFLAFSRMPPQEGQQDHLFVANGGDPFKVLPDNFTAQNWGIVAPPDGFAAALAAQNFHRIQSFDPGFMAGAVLITYAGTPVVLSDEATIKQEGAGSTKGIFPEDSLTGFLDPNPRDLSVFEDTAPSSDEDLICIWIRIENPTNVEYVSLQFDVGVGDFATDYYQRTFTVEATAPLSTDKLRKQQFGVGDFVDPKTRNFGVVISKKDTVNILDQMGQTSLVVQPAVWTRLQVPKSTFYRIGAGTGTWADVKGFLVLVKTAARGAATVYFDDLTMLGGVGMQGDYQYLMTYRNSVTGCRSNANPTPVVVTGAWRQGVGLSSIPQSADPQVDTIEFWRTIGNGSIFFKDFEFPAGPNAIDTVADYYGLDTRPGAVVLGEEELPTFNGDPKTFCGDVSDAVGPHQQRMWFLSRTAGNRGHIYYSAAGLPESVEGFITPTSDDDPLQRLAIWNNALYAFSQYKLYQVIGTEVPFTYVEVYGAPGTTKPFAVAPTPYGIAYFVPDDGLRLFNGVTSQLVGFEALGVVFRGEQFRGVQYTPSTVNYGRNEVYLLDANGVALVYSLSDKTWREIGRPIFALYQEPDTQEILAGLTDRFVLWETAAVFDDDGDPIHFSIQTPPFYVDVRNRGVLQFLFLDVQLNEQTLTPRLLFDDCQSSIDLPSITGGCRTQYEFQIDADMHDVVVCLFGDVLAEVIVYRIETDIYLAKDAMEELRA